MTINNKYNDCITYRDYLVKLIEKLLDADRDWEELESTDVYLPEWALHECFSLLPRVKREE